MYLRLCWLKRMLKSQECYQLWRSFGAAHCGTSKNNSLYFGLSIKNEKCRLDNPVYEAMACECFPADAVVDCLIKSSRKRII